MQGERRTRLWTVVVAALAMIFLAPWQASAAENQLSKVKVAVVNGVVITQAEFDRAVKFASEQASRMGKTLSDAQASDIKKVALDKLIGTELLYQESKKEGVTVDSKAFNDRFAKWRKSFPDDEEYNKVLKALKLTDAEMKADLKRGMTIEKFITKKFVDRTEVSDKEAKAYYDSRTNFFKQPEQVRASHILIKVETGAKEPDKAAALNKIREVQKKEKKGEDFAALAKEYSEGPSRTKGGDLGFFRRGQMVKPFEDAAFKLEPGEVSDIVETKFGYHLIKVVEKKPESITPYDTVKARISAYLKQEKVQKEMAQYVDKLRKGAKVEVFVKSDG